jgi:F-type H+-transporting ATPase subunit epsilon
MNAKTFRLTIAQVDKKLFDDEVLSVSLPGSEGYMTILANHAPLISLLKNGSIRIVTEKETHEEVHVTKGVCEVSHNHVTILV